MASDLTLTVDTSELQLAVDWLDKMGIEGVKLKTKVRNLNQEFAQYKKGLEATTRATKAAEASVGKLGKKMNTSAVITQQAGYQLGDFIVQVQSGTNAFVAFGQQATQVAGTLTLLGGKWIAIGTALGVAIPLITAAGAAYMRTRGSSDELTESLEALEKSLSEIGKTESILNQTMESLEEKFGDQAGVVRQAAKELLIYQKVLASSRLRESVLASAEDIKEFTEVSGQALSKPIQELAEKFQVEFDRALNLQQQLGKLLYAPKDELPAVAEALRAALETAGIPFKELPTDIQAAIVEATNLQITMAELEALAKSAGEAAAGIVTTDVGEASEKRVAALREEAELMNRKMSLLQAEATAEQTVNGILMERMGAKAVELRKMVDLGDLTRDQADAELGAFYAAQEKTLQYEMLVKPALEFMEAIRDAKGDAETLAGLNLDPAIVAAAKAAGILSAEMGDALDSALAMAAAAKAFRETKVSNIPGEGVYLDYNKKAGAYNSRIKELQKEYRDSLRPGRKGRGGGGGKDPAQSAAEYLEKLQQEAEFKLQLVGLSEQEQRGMEIKKQYLETLEQDNRKLTETEQARIDAILKSEEALKKATEAEQRREAIQQAISSNIENALMAVVDGTQSVEDAFKSMLRNILLEIYRQMVAKPLAASITSFLGFANGGAFSGGNVVPFANGGVVGSPTFFPMSGGNTGLMGEAGPEAIMPLKRGSDGKLGVEGGGNVTVQQTFNFAANGDESVKRIIAEAAPKIANLTQKQILDSRRRGGTMKATFG